MRAITAVIIIGAVFLVSTECFADGDDTSDALMHFGISFVVGGLGETVLHHTTGLDRVPRIALGTVIGVIPGLVKELTDEKFSGGDLAADVAGALVGAILANIINERIVVSADRKGARVALQLPLD